MKTNLITLIILMLVFSCASGPTPEQKARWARQDKEAKENTKAIAKFVVDEIWKIPLPELKKRSTRHKSPGSGFHTPYWIVKSKQKVVKEIGTRYLSKMTKACNPKMGDPPLAASLTFNKERLRKKDLLLSVRLGYYLTKDQTVMGKWLKKKRKYEKVHWKCGPWSTTAGVDNHAVVNPTTTWGVSTRSLKGSQIVEELKRLGFPINTEACTGTEYNSTVSYSCNFDLDPLIIALYNKRGTVSLLPNFQIVTKHGKLLEFYIRHMILRKDEEKLSLQEIYNRRFQDPNYSKVLVEYRNEAVNQRNRGLARQARRERQIIEAGKRRDRARRARDRAEMAQSGPIINPYEDSKMDQQFFKSQDRLGKIRPNNQRKTYYKPKAKTYYKPKTQKTSYYKPKKRAFTPNPVPKVKSPGVASSYKENVRKCSIRDGKCNPNAYMLCLIKSQNTLSCHKTPIKFENGMWKHASANSARPCKTILGSSDAVEVVAFSRTNAFSGGAKYKSNDPYGACVKECKKQAAKFKRACASR